MKWLTTSNKLTTFVVIFLTIVGATLFVMSPKVSARMTLNPNPSTTTDILAHLKNTLETCDENVPLRSPGLVGWLARNGYPTQTSITVPYGTNSINLRLHWSSVICSDRSAVLETRMRVMAASTSRPGTLSGINGGVLRFLFGSRYQTLGSYFTSSKGFSYAPVGGFTSTGNYQVTVQLASVNRFVNGDYVCVGSEYRVVNGWDYGSCDRTVNSFTIRVNVLPPPDITVFTSSDCKTIQVRANTPSGHRWDVRVLRNNNNTSVLRQNLLDNKTYNLNITGLQNNGGANYRVRVRDSVTGRPTTSSAKHIAACRPGVLEFTVNCQDGITLRVDTDSGGGRWDARIFVDGHSTWEGAGSPWSLPPGNNNLRRIPTSGRAPDRATRTKSIGPWNDVVGHSFRVRVFDRKNGTNAYSVTRYPGACVQMSCDSSVTSLSFSPSNPEPNEPFDMIFNLGFVATGSGSSNIGSEVARRFNYTAGYKDTGPPPGFAPSSGSNTKRATNLRTTFANIRFNNDGSTYGNVYANFRGHSITCSFGVDGNGDPPCLPSDDCDFPPPIFLSKPFFQAFRGDVIAGSTMYNGSTCTSGTGNIAAFNHGTGSEQFKGSGSQLGILVKGDTIGFISAALRTNTSVHAHRTRGLIFANEIGNPGHFESMSEDCSSRYFAGYDAASANSGALSLSSSAGTEVLHKKGNVSTSNGNNAIRGEKTIYVNGNLRITRNIVYGGEPYASVNDIPNVRIVVRGTIYIDPSVTELHGTYIALPTGGSGGEVFTCALGFLAPTTSQLLNQCTNSSLKVYGSVIAKKVHLYRLVGSIFNDADPTADHDTSAAAEIFVESPLNWLAPPVGSTNSPSYESMTSLPPIL